MGSTNSVYRPLRKVTGLMFFFVNSYEYEYDPVFDLLSHVLMLPCVLQTFDAYVVGKENAPGIVVLQEWWGVDYEIKNHAIHISQLGGGYRALIPE